MTSSKNITIFNFDLIAALKQLKWTYFEINEKNAASILFFIFIFWEKNIERF